MVDVPGRSCAEAMGVSMEGRRIRLEPLRTRHIDALYALACSPDWPFDGGGLPLVEFVPCISTMWARPCAVIRTDTDDLVGVVLGTDEDLRNSTIAVGFALKPEVWGTVWPIEAVVLYLRYLFEGCGFRKVYLEMTESTHERWGGRLDRWATLEARSREQAYTGDRYEDVLRFGLHRHQWDRPQLVDRITGQGRP